MSPRIFTPNDKESLRETMFIAGLELLKEYGMTHMSVEKIAGSAGIGKSTFYNFFDSKEDFVIKLMDFNRVRFWLKIKEMLHDREKLSITESKEILREIINNENSVYQYLTHEDEMRLYEYMPDKQGPDIASESETLKSLFKLFEGTLPLIDYAVVSNLLKILALTAENRNILHESGYKKTQDELFELLFQNIFTEDHK